jgi:Xaa-Pro dipeptidase
VTGTPEGGRPAMALQREGRAREVARKVELVRKWLLDHSFEAALLSEQPSFAWITAGGRSHVSIGEAAGVASVLITRDDAKVLTTNNEEPRLLDEELQGTGLEVVAYPWHESDGLKRTVTRLIEPERVVSDDGSGGFPKAGASLASLRYSLSPTEVDRYRALGRDAAAAVEAACMAASSGDREAEIAGRVAYECARRDILALVNLVAADERIERYRHPIPAGGTFARTLLVALTGRRHGLHASLTRMVHLGGLDRELAARHDAVVRVDARMIAGSVPGIPLRDVLNAAIEEYAGQGFPGVWKLHHQGGLTGYAGREIFATPEAAYPLASHQACAWNPSITRVKSEDTILTGDAGPEVITRTDTWPQKEVEVDDGVIERPAIWEVEG